MTPARVRMHRLADLAGLLPPDAHESQWYVSIGDTPEKTNVTDDQAQTAGAVDEAATAASEALDTSVSQVSVMLEDAGDVLLLSATLGTAIRTHPAHFWRHLLGLNTALSAADRGAITIDLPGHTIYLTQAIAGAASRPNEIGPQFETFVAQARRLIDVLNTLLPLDDEEPTDTLMQTSDMPSGSAPAAFA